MDFCGFLPHYMWNIILDFDGRFWCTDARKVVVPHCRSSSSSVSIIVEVPEFVSALIVPGVGTWGAILLRKDQSGGGSRCIGTA